MTTTKIPPFRYDEKIRERFPNLAGGVIWGMGLVNHPSSEKLRIVYLDEQKRVLEKIGSTPLSELPTIAGWRSAFRLFGVDPTQYRCAVEALLRRLTKKGDIPSINAIVDICNLVSIRYGLPVAGLDMRQVNGKITVRFADGSEKFTPLGETVADKPEAGEVIFIDDAGLVVARRWCWRQSEESAARDETQEALFTIEAQHQGGMAVIPQAMDDLRYLLAEYVGGEYYSVVL